MESTSRGIIIYRQSQNEFLAYDRLPPNEPNACTDSQGNTTRLVVEFPYVVDHCNNAYYNILNGQIIVNEEFDMIPNFPTEGTVVYPLIQYHTQYDGNKLTIYNWRGTSGRGTFIQYYIVFQYFTLQLLKNVEKVETEFLARFFG